MRIASILFVIAAAGQAATWKIDTAHSSAGFTVRHMMVSNVRGEFGKVTGTVEYDAANPSSAKIDATIDASSINTREPKRDAHLKTPDFLDVEKYPTLRFVSKKAEPAGSGKMRITGDLTLHGVTKEVVLDVDGLSPEVKGPGGVPRMGASATTKINRKDFGVVWDRRMDGGGLVVSDEVNIQIDVELIKAQ